MEKREIKIMRIPAKYAPERRGKWVCPDQFDARILSGPNLPKPLHGVNPRTYMGSVTWDKLRKRTYFMAGYKCQICGADCSEPGAMDAHELYDINYWGGTSTFSKVVGICKKCHNFYHSGRLLTLYKQGNPLYTKEKVLDIVEHGFKLIHDWNETHPDEPKLKAYETFIEYYKNDTLKPEMEKLIDKYDISFWGEDKKRIADWEDWVLIYGKTKIPTPYKDYEAWEKAMEGFSKRDNMRQMDNPFKGGAFDEIAELLKS